MSASSRYLVPSVGNIPATLTPPRVSPMTHPLSSPVTKCVYVCEYVRCSQQWITVERMKS